MTAEAVPLRTAPVQREENGMRVFSWSASAPALHARYRLEWRVRHEVARFNWTDSKGNWRYEFNEPGPRLVFKSVPALACVTGNGGV